ncbi:hypothetical protein AC629_40990 [Bradyrhizobium sp. NAS80.1]|uniref:hypothetical protein n=1 Tax=Bradyrhizobium sp. NAS80.1 TaxID=1680159 RepID=UPI00095EC77B|nr:hypothetical protein [Bradyrhizobium sp. NAS80.1]OKO69729.1 hypothetical protein AC629_40990 [Bradyrhizobium sp. NAS80.1]
MSEGNGTLDVIALIAGDAIEREGELRCVGISPDVRFYELLLRLTIIRQLARGALSEASLAGLPPEAHVELAKCVADSVRKAADEDQPRTQIVH